MASLNINLMSNDGIHDVVYMLYSMAVSSLVWTVPSRASDGPCPLIHGLEGLTCRVSVLVGMNLECKWEW